MLNRLFTYSLTFILLFTIAAPTILNLSDFDISETSLLLEIDEETESNEKLEEVKELKILGIPVVFNSIYQYTSRGVINTYNTKIHQTIYYSLESPPPEFS